MSLPRRPVRTTENFERTLDEVQRFLETELDAATAFADLLDRLDSWLDLVSEHPKMGGDLLRRAPRSVEARALARRLASELGEGESVREWVLDDHLVLYLQSPDAVWLLAIRHQRQLGYDLPRTWGPRD